MSVIDRLNDFRSAIGLADQLIVDAHKTDAAGKGIWGANSQRMITEAAFMRAFVGWETFLESCFNDYLQGLPSAAGNLIPRYVQPISTKHANDILIGAQKFVDYSNPETLRKLARLYLLNGHPFESVLASIQTDIFDLKTIRNAAAHLSSTTSHHLDALANRKLGRAVANITVYDLVLSADPSSTSGETVYKRYMSILDAAAYQITHA